MHFLCVCEFYVHVCVCYVYVCVFYGYVYLILILFVCMCFLCVCMCFICVCMCFICVCMCILSVCMCIICACLCMCMYVSDVPGVGRTKKYTIFLTRKQPANELILCICILGQWSRVKHFMCNMYVYFICM